MCLTVPIAFSFKCVFRIARCAEGGSLHSFVAVISGFFDGCSEQQLPDELFQLVALDHMSPQALSFYNSLCSFPVKLGAQRRG